MNFLGHSVQCMLAAPCYFEASIWRILE